MVDGDGGVIVVATCLDTTDRQCTSADYTQALDDQGAGVVGSAGEALENALTEPFVDSFKRPP